MEATLAQGREPAPTRILVHEVNWLGDLVMTMPALAALRRAFPAARISVMVDSRLAAFFDGAGWIEEVIPIDRASKRSVLAEMPRLVTRLRALHFDLAVILPNSFESALRAALARIPIRAGFVRNGRGWMLTRRAVPGPHLVKRHQVHYWLEMLTSTLGVYGDPRPVAIEAAPRHLLRMREWLAIRRRANSRLVAVAPGAAYGPAKEWPQSHYAALVSLLGSRGVQCVLVGGPSEIERCESIAAASGRNAIVAAGRTNIGELMALLSLCDGFAGNDSGAAHLAASLGIATVAIFGSTSPQRTGPLGPRTQTLYQGLSCSPCMARTCRFGHYNCLLEIQPQQVIDALENLGALK
ncbi:MAG: lipopolysaccharide heptosyltransferase II [Candidatus Binataceae bacterium]